MSSQTTKSFSAIWKMQEEVSDPFAGLPLANDVDDSFPPDDCSCFSPLSLSDFPPSPDRSAPPLLSSSRLLAENALSQAQSEQEGPPAQKEASRLMSWPILTTTTSRRPPLAPAFLGYTIDPVPATVLPLPASAEQESEDIVASVPESPPQRPIIINLFKCLSEERRGGAD